MLLCDMWRIQIACADGIQGDKQFPVPSELGYVFLPSLYFVPVCITSVVFFSKQEASNYYCINFNYKSPCIFSVAARDRLWASSGREWVTCNMMDTIAHLSPRKRQRATTLLLRLRRSKSPWSPFGEECTFQFRFKSMLHKTMKRDY